ncbi:MAG: restriction endonuclease subunit R [Phormidesmis sp.]
MVQTKPARDLSLEDLKERFGLQVTLQPDFFAEWSDLPTPSADEQERLSRVQQNYMNLSVRQNFSEEAVKMVVLSPLLDLAAFYQAPFAIQTEESVELLSEDEGYIVRGKIDVLLVRQRLWILVIESKSTQFDVLTALPQALTYMLSAPNREQPVYGLLVNGREFVFVKLVHKPALTCIRSFALSVEREHELAQVLSALKIIRQRILDIRE